MPEASLYPMSTRIQVNLPVNTVGQINAVAAIMHQIYPRFRGATCHASVLNPHTFEEYYVDRNQNLVINRMSVLCVDLDLPIGDPDLNVNVAIVELIVRGEYQRAGSTPDDISIVIHPLYRIV